MFDEAKDNPVHQHHSAMSYATCVDDAALAEDCDHVGVLHRGQTVCDDDHRAVAHELRYGVLHQLRLDMYKFDIRNNIICAPIKGTKSWKSRQS